jgi:hypothetical protein
MSFHYLKYKAMNKTTMKSLVSALFCLFTLSSISQEQDTAPSPRMPRWVSDKGYWVVESNIHSPLNHTIWLYTNDEVLIYKETLSGVKLNPEKRAVKMKLKKVLETAVLAWEQNKVKQEDKHYVAAILK